MVKFYKYGKISSFGFYKSWIIINENETNFRNNQIEEKKQEKSYWFLID